MDFLQESENRKLTYAEVVKQRANTTGTNLQHLNEDCLLEIFSVTTLTVMDLCSLAVSCTRFQQIIRRIFPKELSIYVWKNWVYRFSSKKYSNSKEVGADDAEFFLKNFGSILTSISIVNWYELANAEPWHFVLKLIAKYCVNTLESITINNIDIPEALTVELKPIFKRLRILHLGNVSIVDDKTQFADMDSLIELRVINVKNCSAILENIFPKLERFTYEQFKQFNRSLLKFISLNPSLKFLEFQNFKDDDTFKAITLQVIANRCKDLKELKIGMKNMTASSLLPLQDIKSLIKIQLQRVSYEDLNFMSSLPNLRELHLTDCLLPNHLNQFAISTQLTKLNIRLQLVCHSFDVVGIIRQLTNLEELIVDDSWSDINVLDEKNFSKIVDIVKGRKNVLTLKYNFNFKLENIYENQKVRFLPLYG